MIEVLQWVWLWVISGVSLIKLMDMTTPSTNKASAQIYVVGGLLGFIFVALMVVMCVGGLIRVMIEKLRSR